MKTIAIVLMMLSASLCFPAGDNIYVLTPLRGQRIPYDGVLVEAVENGISPVRRFKKGTFFDRNGIEDGYYPNVPDYIARAKFPALA